MLQPTGPLPAVVYWRRRAAAVAATVVGLVAVVGLTVALTGGTDPAPTAEQTALGAGSSTATPPPATPAATTANPATTATAPATTAKPAATTAKPAATAPATTAKPATPPACADKAIRLTAQVAAPSYPVGQQPVFRILVDNVGASACTRDLNAALQQVLVYSADGRTRLWSSNDCYPGSSTDAPVLAPKDRKTYSVKWSGTTSEPTCTAERARVARGSYTVVVALGSLRSAPVPFTLT